MTTQRTSRRRSVTVKARLTWRPFRVAEVSLAAGLVLSSSLDSVGLAPTLIQAGVVGDYTVRRIRAQLGMRSTGAVVGAPLEAYFGVTVVSLQARD